MQLDLWEILPYNEGSTLKVCRECNLEKPEEAFYVQYHKKDGSPTRGGVCSNCKQEQSSLRKELRTSAGTPPKECQCCGSEATLFVDHCHDTLDFRGWLCHKCNAGIGLLGDTIEGLENALAYMKGKS